MPLHRHLEHTAVAYSVPVDQNVQALNIHQVTELVQAQVAAVAEDTANGANGTHQKTSTVEHHIDFLNHCSILAHLCRKTHLSGENDKLSSTEIRLPAVGWELIAPDINHTVSAKLLHLR